RAEAGVDQAPSAQAGKRLGIMVDAPRLDQHLAVPIEAQPTQVFENALDKLGLAPAGIEIFDPQMKRAVVSPRGAMTQNRRIGVTKVQPPRRRGREACYGHRFELSRRRAAVCRCCATDT